MKVLVGMSGGVDSSVAALLLQQQGAEVEGVYFHQVSDRDFECEGSTCCGEAAVARARQTARQLGIHLNIVDLRKEFDSRVIQATQQQIDRGENPAPCSNCNAAVRAPSLRKYAAVVGASHYATGHYFKCVNGVVYRATDATKDQSYMMALVNKDDLKSWLCPLGSLHKTSVRDIAQSSGLPSARTPDSQDLCFGHLLHNPERKIIDEAGHHVGATNRRAVVGATKGFSGMFVHSVEPNIVRIGKTRPESTSVRLRSINMHSPLPSSFDAVTRYRGEPILATISGDAVDLSRPITPSVGQVLAMYDGEQLCGGGIVC